MASTKQQLLDAVRSGDSEGLIELISRLNVVEEESNGGSMPPQTFFGAAATHAPTTGHIPLPWVPFGGPSLLDLTDPTNPAVLKAGVYGINLSVGIEEAAQPAGVTAWATLTPDFLGSSITQSNFLDLSLNPGGESVQPQGPLAATVWIPEGGIIYADCSGFNGDVDLTFFLYGSLQLIGGS